MNSFNNIRIENSTTIKSSSSVLKDLGKINVICGKNNSGKTTLLKAIVNPKNCIEGKILEEKDIEDIYRNASGLTSTNVMNHNNKRQWQPGELSKEYKNVLKDTITSKEIWFKSEAGLMASSLKVNWEKNPERAIHRPSYEAASKAFEKLFQNNVIRVLIPPKRELDLGVKVNAGQAIKESGEGILNKLFFSKNQSELSDEEKNYELFVKAFTKISDGYKLNIFLGKSDELLLQFAYKNEPWRKAEDCGLGLQDLVVLLYFSIFSEHQLLLIEEPETHMHPDMQRRLIKFFRGEPKKQYFLTTHSNIFLNSELIERVFFTSFFDSQIDISDATGKAQILNELGYEVSDNLIADLIILVEGPTDSPIIKHYINLVEGLEKYNIKTWPLTGDIMSQVDLTVFSDTYKVIAVVDKDPGSEEKRKQFMENCRKSNIPVTVLERSSIENYFTVDALRKVFGSAIPPDFTCIDPNKAMSKQLDTTVKRSNHKIIRHMTLNDILGTDLHKFILGLKEYLPVK